MKTLHLSSTSTLLSLNLTLLGTVALAMTADFSSLAGLELLWALLGLLCVVAPLLLNALLGALLPAKASQRWLCLAALLFAAFAIGWSVWLFAFHADPQAPVALLWTGVYSLPVMIPLWVVAFTRRHSPGAQDGIAVRGPKS